MKIKVWTKQPNHFIQQAGQLLQQRGHSQVQADKLRNGQINGDLITFENISNAQFCALEDTAVRTSLQYDGSQEEPQQETAVQEKSLDLSSQDGTESAHHTLVSTGMHPLRAARLLRNLTIAELATATGVSIRMLQYVEHGHTAGVHTRKKLCNYFGARPDELGLLQGLETKGIDNSKKDAIISRSERA